MYQRSSATELHSKRGCGITYRINRVPSPTVSTESTFIMASIAAHERRVIRCYDNPSAFVNTDVDEDVVMVLKGDLAEMMMQVAPEVY